MDHYYQNRGGIQQKMRDKRKKKDDEEECTIFWHYSMPPSPTDFEFKVFNIQLNFKDFSKLNTVCF